MADRLAGYVTVATRLARFYERYPEGSLQTQVIADDGTIVRMVAYAFRDREDPRPGMGHAEENREDTSSFVNKQGAAYENCETSAWGRALAALGFETSMGVASATEIQSARSAGREPTGELSEAGQKAAQIMRDKRWSQAKINAFLRKYHEQQDHLLAELEAGREGSL